MSEHDAHLIGHRSETMTGDLESDRVGGQDRIQAIMAHTTEETEE